MARFSNVAEAAGCCGFYIWSHPQWHVANTLVLPVKSVLVTARVVLLQRADGVTEDKRSAEQDVGAQQGHSVKLHEKFCLVDLTSVS